MNPNATNQIPAWFDLRSRLCLLPEWHWRDGRIAAISRALTYGYNPASWPRSILTRLAFRANMEGTVAKGKGYRAGKRCAEIARAAAAEIEAMVERMKRAREEDAAIERIRRERARAWADEVSELVTESRSVAHHYRRAVNE